MTMCTGARSYALRDVQSSHITCACEMATDLDAGAVINLAFPLIADDAHAAFDTELDVCARRAHVLRGLPRTHAVTYPTTRRNGHGFATVLRHQGVDVSRHARPTTEVAHALFTVGLLQCCEFHRRRVTQQLRDGETTRYIPVPLLLPYVRNGRFWT